MEDENAKDPKAFLGGMCAAGEYVRLQRYAKSQGLGVAAMLRSLVMRADEGTIGETVKKYDKGRDDRDKQFTGRCSGAVKERLVLLAEAAGASEASVLRSLFLKGDKDDDRGCDGRDGKDGGDEGDGKDGKDGKDPATDTTEGSSAKDPDAAGEKPEVGVHSTD